MPTFSSKVWTTCPYKNRDGQFNPDARLVNNVGDFQDLSEAVFYSTVAWAIGNKVNTSFETNAGTLPFILPSLLVC